MAVDHEGGVIALQNLTEADIASESFTGFKNIAQVAPGSTSPFITNNMVLDANMASATNTNFANLRLVIVFPLSNIGSVYIDQHVRQGVVTPQMADRLMRTALTLIEDGRLQATAGDERAL